MRYTPVLLIAILLVPFGAADPADNRALLIYQEGDQRFKTAAENIEKLLENGGVTNIEVIGIPKETTVAELRNLVETHLDTPTGNDDPKMFYYRGHGTFRGSDGAPLDEGPRGDVKMSPIKGWDDDLKDLFKDIDGKIFTVYNMCNGGGMFDGSSDPMPEDGSAIGSLKWDMSANGDTFHVFMVSALQGRADGALGDPPDGKVTVGEVEKFIQDNYKAFGGAAFRDKGVSADDVVLVELAAPGGGPSTPIEEGPSEPKDCEPAPNNGTVGGIIIDDARVGQKVLSPSLMIGVFAGAFLVAFGQRRR